MNLNSNNNNNFSYHLNVPNQVNQLPYPLSPNKHYNSFQYSILNEHNNVNNYYLNYPNVINLKNIYPMNIPPNYNNNINQMINNSNNNSNLINNNKIININQNFQQQNLMNNNLFNHSQNNPNPFDYYNFLNDINNSPIIAPKKFNSVKTLNNLSKKFALNSNNFDNQNSFKKFPGSPNKRRRSSLFQNETNKTENDIRDFKRFCDGLKCEEGIKCELPNYICSQKGSRIMQKYLNKFPSNIKTLLILKIGKNLGKIMIDTYGNYFCQKMFQICSNEQRILILEYINNEFIEISKSPSGTHVIQAILELINTEDEINIIINCIKNHELELAYDNNGTHVLQKIISTIDEKYREDLNDILLERNNLRTLCLDSKGICVVKKLINSIKNEKYKNLIINIIFDNCSEISKNSYGNYVIQYIFEEWGLKFCDKIIQFCIENCDIFSLDIYSSKIIDKIIDYLIKDNNIEYLKKIQDKMFNLKRIIEIYKNRFGKFLLIKLIKNINYEERNKIKEELNNNNINQKDKKSILKLLRINNKIENDINNSDKKLNK